MLPTNLLSRRRKFHCIRANQACCSFSEITQNTKVNFWTNQEAIVTIAINKGNYIFVEYQWALPQWLVSSHYALASLTPKALSRLHLIVQMHILHLSITARVPLYQLEIHLSFAAPHYCRPASLSWIFCHKSQTFWLSMTVFIWSSSSINIGVISIDFAKLQVIPRSTPHHPISFLHLV